MKTRHLLPFAFAASTLAACASSVDDGSITMPPDAENGLETLDGRDDSFAIRPGSPEAEAVVAYVNRDIADDAAGVVFQDELDTKLHAWAARNIAEFRAGDDGTFGTADDQRFDDLTQLDRVRWVGRSALMRLFELAEAAGLFQRPTLDCADYVDHDRWNNYYITSYADLLEYENSRCSVVTGNVYLQISGTDLLPPSARSIRNLRYLETINGDLHITTSNHWNSVHFETLETVTGDVRAESPVGRAHTLDFAALKSASSIYMSQIQSSLFPALAHNDDIELRDSDLEGFTALETAAGILIYQRAQGTWNVDFPSLAEVETLQFDIHRSNSWNTPDVTFTGGFAELRSVSYLALNNGKYGQFSFPKLHTVDALRSTTAVDPFVGMTALEHAEELTSTSDKNTVGVHGGPPALETIGSLRVTTGEDVDGYDSLRAATGSITVTSQRGVQGFDALESIAGSITLDVGRDRDRIELNGFNRIEEVHSISIIASRTLVDIGPLFESLEFTEGQISITANHGFTDNIVFRSLAGMGGNLRVDDLKADTDMMPELQVVDGTVSIHRTPQELVGFPKLELIEGSLSLNASMNTWTGMQNLTAIGGNLSVPRSLPQADLDDFLNRLEEFSGTIIWN